MLTSFLTEVEKRPASFVPQDGAIVNVHTRPNKVGQLIDINMEGLTFICISLKKSLPKFTYIDILLRNNKFFLDNIQVEVISVTKLYSFKYRNPTNILQCNVRYSNLSLYHVHNLEYFISDFTVKKIWYAYISPRVWQQQRIISFRFNINMVY